MALTAIDSRDAVAHGSELRPRPRADSPETLLASFEAANELIHRTIHTDFPESEATTSVAAVLWVGAQEAFIAWAGFRVRVHRVRQGAFELLTPTILSTPQGGPESLRTGVVVRSGQRDCLFGGDLGQQPRPPIHTATVALRPGELLFLSGAWAYEPPERAQEGRDLLAFLSKHGQSIDIALAECLRRESWARHLPGVLMRVGGADDAAASLPEEGVE
ncbi:MAG: hypothetical protein JXB05_05805 [Myxococcaceae bacterium]|nr:hypothetical protein [Myxococcaceae bacterium]